MTTIRANAAQVGDSFRYGESERGGVADEDGAPRITWRRVELEDQIHSVLSEPPELGERIEMAFRRKEHELLVLFGRLSVLDSKELSRRLSLGLVDDPIARQFMRLIADRRVRLLSFLDGARRREAMRRAR